MSSAAYKNWVSKGRPYTLCRPCKELQATIRGHGFIVYDYPNDVHLTASKPEDHTPFSATGWPVGSAFGVAHALDIMPKNSSKAAMKELADLARTLMAAKDNGVEAVKWLKYMNWTDENGTCRQENWKTGKRVTVSSSDSGHIHLSARSDMDNVSTDGWDPYNLTTTNTTLSGDDDMPFLIQHNASTAVFLSDGITARWLTQEDYTDITKSLYPEGTIKLGFNGKIRIVGNRNLIGRILGPCPEDFQDLADSTSSLSVSDTQLDSIANKIGDKVVGAASNNLSDADKSVIVELVKQALREGAN